MNLSALTAEMVRDDLFLWSLAESCRILGSEGLDLQT